MIVSSSAFLHFFHSLLFRIFNPQPCHDHIVYLLSSSFLWFFFPLERLHWFILRFVYGKTPSMFFVSSFYIIPAIVFTREKFFPCLPRKGQTKTLWRKETHNTKIVNHFKISVVNIYSKYIPTISSLSTSVFTIACFSVGKKILSSNVILTSSFWHLLPFLNLFFAFVFSPSLLKPYFDFYSPFFNRIYQLSSNYKTKQ